MSLRREVLGWSMFSVGTVAIVLGWGHVPYIPTGLLGVLFVFMGGLALGR